MEAARRHAQWDCYSRAAQLTAADLHASNVTGFVRSNKHRTFMSCATDGLIKWWSLHGRYLFTVAAHRRPIVAMLAHPCNDSDPCDAM